MSEKKIILLTGCTGKLGTCFVNNFSNQYKIVGIARNSPQYSNTELLFFQRDILVGVNDILDSVLSRYGKIDILINNAFWTHRGPIEERSLRELEQEFKMNVFIPLITANRIVSRFWAHNIDYNRAWNNNVLNISSIAAIKIYPGGQSIYSATKSALNTVTKHMAEEYKKYDIRVNALAPNSFGGDGCLLRTEDICKHIVEIIEGKESGEIRVIDNEETYIL